MKAECIPTVSVVMTTYNGAPNIIESINSILSQTFSDFEFIVVDDCSIDDTVARLERYVDPRLRIVRCPRNLGVVGSRNLGFSIARGRYIAALDHDDISMPDRLERQVAYLDTHPDVVLVGSRWLSLHLGTTQPDPYDVTEPMLVRWRLHVTNPMCYSSLMARGNCLRLLSPPMRQERVLADDFDLYHRMLTMGEIARLTDVLTIYRVHENNTYLRRMEEMRGNAVLVLTDAYWRWFGPRSPEVAELMTRLVAGRETARNDEELCHLRECLDTLAQSFIAERLPPPHIVAAIHASVDELWYLAFTRRIKSGGLSSLRHIDFIARTTRRQQAYLLKEILSNFVPAKNIIKKLIRNVNTIMPISGDISRIPYNSSNIACSHHPSETWNGFVNCLVIGVCIPLLAVIHIRAVIWRVAACLSPR